MDEPDAAPLARAREACDALDEASGALRSRMLELIDTVELRLQQEDVGRRPALRRVNETQGGQHIAARPVL